MPAPTTPLEYPRLRQDLTFLETGDGIYFSGAGPSFVIRGPGAYSLLSDLLPHLDGSAPIAPVLASLPAAQREVVLRFLEVLRSKDLLHEGLVPIGGSDPVPAGLDTQRAFLADLGAEPAAIERIVDAHVLVLGEDTHTQPLIHGLMGNGVGARHGSVEGRPLGEADPDPVSRDTFVVPVFTGRDSSRALRHVDAWTGRATLIPVWQSGRRLLIGPWQAPGDGPVVRSAILRASAHASPAVGLGFAAMAFGVPHAEPELGDAVHDLMAGILGLEILRILGGVDAGSLRLALLSMEVDTLQVTRQPVALHPALFPGVDPLPLTVVEHPPSILDETATEQRYRRFASVVGDPAGLFTGFDDDELPQLPIKVGRIEGTVDGGPVIGTDLRHVLAARTQAACWAAAEYALAHARTHLDTPARDEPVVDPRELSTWLGGPDRVDAGVLSHAVGGRGGTCVVPREAVVAGPDDRSPGAFSRDLSGVGVGDDWTGAVESGLRSAWCHVEARSIEQGRSALREVRLDRLAGHQGSRVEARGLMLLRSALGEEGRSIRIFAPPGAAPVAIVWLPGQGAWWSHGQSWAEAAERILSWRVAVGQLASVPGAARALRHAAQPLGDSSLRLGAEPASVEPLFRPVSDVAQRIDTEGSASLVVDLTPPDLRGVVSVARVLLRSAAGTTR